MKETVNLFKGDEFLEDMLTHVIKKWKTKLVKVRVITKYDIKLMGHNAVKIDDWVVLQKSNPSYYAKSYVTIDPFRATNILKT